eukprot:gene955-271_t
MAQNGCSARVGVNVRNWNCQAIKSRPSDIVLKESSLPFLWLKASLNTLVHLRRDNTIHSWHTQLASDVDCRELLSTVKKTFLLQDATDQNNDNDDDNKPVPIVDDNDNNNETGTAKTAFHDDTKNDDDDDEPYSTHLFNMPSLPRESLRGMIAADAAQVRVNVQRLKSTANVHRFFRTVEEVNAFIIRFLKCRDSLLPPFVSLCEGVSHIEIVPAGTTTDFLLKVQLFGTF